jgi:hypothetical protein
MAKDFARNAAGKQTGNAQRAEIQLKPTNESAGERTRAVETAFKLEARVGIGQGTPIQSKEYRKFPHK